MAVDNLLSTLEQTLKQTKAVRGRLVARLTELESESASLRSELRELDHLTSQTEAAMYRLLSGSLSNSGDAGGYSGERGESEDTPLTSGRIRRFEQERL